MGHCLYGCVQNNSNLHQKPQQVMLNVTPMLLVCHVWVYWGNKKSFNIYYVSLRASVQLLSGAPIGKEWVPKSNMTV